MLSRVTALVRVMQQKRFHPAAIWLLDLLIILVMVLVFFRSHIFTDATFIPTPFDWKPLTHPTLTYTGESLARGEFPLWNPHWLAGFPHFAVPSNAVLYPTTILFGILDWPTAINWVLIGHIYLFSAFSYAVGREIIRNRLVSLTLALWGAGGSLSIGITFSGHMWGVQTLAWMPLLFLCLRKILYGGHAYWALLASAAFVPMYLGGDVQWLTYALYWLAAYTALELAYCLFVRKQPLSTVLSKGGLCLAAIGVGVLLVGIQLLPSRELLEQSIRKDGVTLGYLRSFKLSTGAILNRILLDPFLFSGRLSAALALVSLLGRNAHERYTLWLTAAACVLYGLMPDWFYYGIIQHISTLASQRFSMRILFVVNFVLFLLAAYGLQRLLQTKSDGGLRRGRLSAGVIRIGETWRLPNTGSVRQLPGHLTVWILTCFLLL